ncbi:MAG: hypothetical protein Q9217_005741 [Psora testacea]
MSTTETLSQRALALLSILLSGTSSYPDALMFSFVAFYIGNWVLYGILMDVIWAMKDPPDVLHKISVWLDFFYDPFSHYERVKPPVLFWMPPSSDDESNSITLSTSPPTPAKTTWTLLIYLTGPATGCFGGETIFYPELGPAKRFSGKSSEGTEPITVELEVGMALLHKHGQDCLLHEGARVAKGEKWVIRSDLCVRR